MFLSNNLGIVLMSILTKVKQVNMFEREKRRRIKEVLHKKKGKKNN